MNQLDKPLYAVVACIVGAVVFVIGAWIFSPFMMKVATALLGLIALVAAAVRFSQVRSLTTLLLGVAALWMVLGKWILSMITNPRVVKDIMTRGQAESWETYVVLAGALLLIAIALLAAPGKASESTPTEKGGS